VILDHEECSTDADPLKPGVFTSKWGAHFSDRLTVENVYMSSSSPG
jgi:hypothetical protein